MSNWNESPDWNLLSTINNGKEFSAADGLLASDVVRIVENVVYVYNQQNELQGTVSTIDSRLYAVQANIGSLSELTTENKSSIVASINEVNENQTATRNSLADLKEALYGYVLDTTEIETESVIPYTVEVGGTTYNLVDDVRGLVKEIKGGTVKSNNLFDINSANKFLGGSSFSKNGNQITVSQNSSDAYLFASVLLDTSLAGKTISLTALAMTSGLNNTYIRILWLAKSGSVGSGELHSNIITGNSFQKLTLKGVVPENSVGDSYSLCILFYSNYASSLEDGVTYSATFKDIMLNLGDNALPYEPYFDGLKSVEYTGLEVKGKNLFDISKVVQSTYIKSDNKDITCSSYGSPIGLLKNLCPSLKVGDIVTLSLIVKSTTSVPPVFVQIQGQILNFKIGAGSVTFTVTEDGLNSNFYLYNTTFENRDVPTTTVFTDIMIELGDTATDYKPYREPVSILPFTTTLRGVNAYKDRIIITKNESDDYYTATKISNLISYNFTGDEADWHFVNWGDGAKRGFIYLEQYCDNVGICDKYDWNVFGSRGMWIHGEYPNQLNILQPNDYWANAGVTDVATLKTYLKSIGGFNVVVALSTPTTEVLSTTLTESDVMPLLELGGSVEIINENSLYVTGSTALEMVYKLINNTTTTSEVTE